jgi:hypothetical protein
VGVALYAFYFSKPKGIGLVWPEPWGEIVAIAIFAALGFLIYRRTK